MINNIGFAITGSFCTHEKALNQLKTLSKKYNILPIVSEKVLYTDTRFGKASELIKSLREITGNDVITNIVGAEPLGPKGLVDMIVVTPCTGNTLAKIKNGISDNAVTLAVKSCLRKNIPVVLGVCSNDAIGGNLVNIATLLNRKNFYFVPLKQDDCINKPYSFVCDFNSLEKTIILAEQNKQIQPIFFS